jgi:NADPH-dependent F420 reductase
MRIALLGGTGALGGGLALRWGRDSQHDLVIGSRDPERAREAAGTYEAILDGQGVERSIPGFENGMAAERGDVVVLAVSSDHLSEVLGDVGPRLPSDAIVVTPAVDMESGENRMTYAPPTQGSVAALVREEIPARNPVVGAFHTLPADRLQSLEESLDMHTLVFGDDEAAIERVRSLAGEINGLETLLAGPLENAPAVESLTPLLLTLGQQNNTPGLGLKLTD